MTENAEKKKRLCVVPICEGQRYDLVHKFPQDNARAEEWMRILNIPMFENLTVDQIRKRYFVCSQHFIISDYKNVQSRGLNKTAYPSINLTSFDNDNTILSMEKKSSNKVRESPPFENETVSLPSPRCLNSNQSIDDQIELYVVSDDLCEEITKSPDPEVEYIEEVESKTERREIFVSKRKVMKPRVVQRKYQNLIVIESDEYEASDAKKVKHGTTTVELDFDVECLSDSGQSCGVMKIPVDTLEVTEEEIEETDEIEELIVESEEKSVVAENTLEVVHPNYTEPLVFHNFWLRDHCRCDECYNSENSQRRFNILDIPIDVKPAKCDLTEKTLKLEWPDGHRSTYDLDVLVKMKYEIYRHTLTDEKLTTRPILWDKSLIQESDVAHVNLNDYLSDDGAAKKILISLVRYGVAFVEKVPSNLSSTEMTIKRLFPIQKTIFGEMWTLTDHKAHSDSAYSKEYLAAHNDNTYLSDAGGLMTFHCVSHSGTGGETLLVDGFKVANDIKFKSAAAYERLSTLSIPAEYIEEQQNHRHCAPIIRKDPLTGHIEQMRFNMYDRSPFNSLPHDQIMQFYRDYRLLANEVQSPNNEWWFKLSPGTVMFVDNWRVLHGRAQYTGKRTLCGSYVSRTDFLSAARVWGAIL